MGATVQVAESSWGMATMHTQFGWGPGAGCEAPAVQWAAPTTVQMALALLQAGLWPA